MKHWAFIAKLSFVHCWGWGEQDPEIERRKEIRSR
jgi:hypothetical protein